MFLSGFQSATVKPYKGGKVFLVGGIADVEFATLLLVGIGLSGVEVGNVFLDAILACGFWILTIT